MFGGGRKRKMTVGVDTDTAVRGDGSYERTSWRYLCPHCKRQGIYKRRRLAPSEKWYKEWREHDTVGHDDVQIKDYYCYNCKRTTDEPIDKKAAATGCKPKRP